MELNYEMYDTENEYYPGDRISGINGEDFHVVDHIRPFDIVVAYGSVRNKEGRPENVVSMEDFEAYKIKVINETVENIMRYENGSIIWNYDHLLDAVKERYVIDNDYESVIFAYVSKIMISLNEISQKAMKSAMEKEEV